MTTGVEPPVERGRRWSDRRRLPAGPMFDPPLPVVIPPRPHQPQLIARRQLEALRHRRGQAWQPLDPGTSPPARPASSTSTPSHTVLATVSGTAALRLAVVAAAGMARPGDVAVLPSYTFTATAEVLLQLGYQLRYADVDADTWTLDPAATRAAIERRPGPAGRRRRHLRQSRATTPRCGRSAPRPAQSSSPTPPPPSEVDIMADLCPSWPTRTRTR